MNTTQIISDIHDDIRGKLSDILHKHTMNPMLYKVDGNVDYELWRKIASGLSRDIALKIGWRSFSLGMRTQRIK